jgi:hypothetical protein
MKPRTIASKSVPQNYPTRPEPKIYFSKKLISKVVPPDEETVKKHNEMVKAFPFRFHFKEKKNDPL